MEQPVVELRSISKRFAKVLANDDVSMKIGKGEVVALLGENGAGKSTIMKILYGLYHQTSGQIFVDGTERRINSPKDAMDLGISMIQQQIVHGSDFVSALQVQGLAADRHVCQQPKHRPRRRGYRNRPSQHKQRA